MSIENQRMICPYWAWKRRYLLCIGFVFSISYKCLAASPDGSQSQNSTIADPETQKESEKKREILKIAKVEYNLGLADFKAERYRDALQRFVRVYRLNPHPNLVYNMARSFEQLKEYQNAADYYRKYLDIEPSSKDREQVEMTISTMIRLAKDGENQVQTSEQRTIRKVGWGGVVMGGTLILGGSMFGIRALNRSEELGRFGPGDSLQDFNRVESQRDEAALLSDLFMVSGVAISSLGLYFALRSDKTQEESSVSSLHLSFSPNGLVFQGVF